MENIITQQNEYDQSNTAGWLAFQPNHLIYQELDGQTPKRNDIVNAIKQHKLQVPRMLVLEGYLKSIMAVLNRMRYSKIDDQINYKIIYAEPRYIIKTIIGFLYGNGATYSPADDIESDVKLKKAINEITRLYRRQNIQSVDTALEEYIGTYGRGLELTYIDDNAEPRSKAVRPTNAFSVYNNETEKKPLYSVNYTLVPTADGKKSYYEVAVYDYTNVTKYRSNEVVDNSIKTLNIVQQFNGDLGEFVDTVPHNIKTLPLTEIWNNEDLIGDFEPVISLIDAKNELGSDHLNGIRQFIENILVLNGVSLGNDETEKNKAHADMKQKRRVEVKSDGQSANPSISYLTSQIDHLGMEATRKALTEDIAKYSFCPDFTTDRAGNIQSGTAMENMLNGIKALGNTKTPFLINGLQNRLQKYSNVLSTKGGEDLDVLDVVITFTDNTPSINQEIAMITASALSVGVKPQLIGEQYDFVNGEDDFEEEQEFEPDDTPLFANGDTTSLEEPEMEEPEVNEAETEE